MSSASLNGDVTCSLLVLVSRYRLLLILLLAGCEQSPATLPQKPPTATGQTGPTVEPITPPATPEASDQASEITGKVVGIIDGDTIDILTADKTTIRIRMKGIDAPETDQPFGKTQRSFSVNSSAGRSSEL